MQLLDNRYRDYVGFPPLLRSGENDGKSFSDFYRASQIKLLSALDNALSQKAEDTLNQFAAVKKAEVNFQTSLGNRQGQLGINLIGAFAESQNHGIGWQVRVYGAQQDGKGFNAGVFYRHITDSALFGANAFVDYENHKLGNFYRYSIGGEAQNKYGSFAANYYVPITDEKRKDGGVIFSRKGYDAKLRLNIPNAKFIKAAVDYYNFGNENGSESDNGLRYGAELQPTPALRIGIFYDDGEEELGGEVSYTHTIGEVQQSQSANTNWAPDLFAAISREHSQRIISVSVNVSVSPLSPNTPIMPTFNAFGDRAVVGTNPATIGAINIPAGYTIGMLPQGLAQMGGTLTWNSVVSGAITFGIEVNNASQTTTLAIAATGYVEVGRVASVHATLAIINAAVPPRTIVVNTTNKILVTLLPPFNASPYQLTITQDLDNIIVEVINSSGSSPLPGNIDRIGAFVTFSRGAYAYMLTIVEGSEEYQSTLYAQADMPFDMPGFSPPSFPQMAELAFAANPRISPSFPPPPTRGQAAAGINSPQGGECCGASRVIDGDFISPSFSPPPTRGQATAGIQPRLWRGHNRVSDYRRIFAICA